MAFRLPAPRSLYWRIASASLALLAVALLVQTSVLLAMLSRPTGLRARVAAQERATAVAGELAEALENDPATDVRRVLQDVAAPDVPVFFVASNGVVSGRGRADVPEPLARRLLALADLPEGGADRPVGVARVDVLGQIEGHVVVLPRRPVWGVVRDVGPWALAGAVVAALGVAGALAWLAFAPAHRRLHALEEAATRLGRGDLGARAPDDGADEIGRVSRAFNQTADALAAQIQQVLAEQDVRRQLLADVSHELHTPLTTIRGYVETLRMPGIPVSEEARMRYLAIVDDEAVRLERLLGDLLDLARMEAGGHVLHPEREDVAGLWARLRDRHAPAAGAAGVSLEFTGTASSVTADRGRLEQALSNLVANAIRFTPAGGTVRVSAQRVKGAVRFDVSDTGPGLGADEQGRVFDRFYKGDPARRRGGTGLGLSIVRAIAEAHGGTVAVTSTQGTGSTFSMVIPQDPEDPQDPDDEHA